MNDNQVMHAMVLDDTYRTERVLARGEGGVTELVTIDGAGPFVRKKIPSELARRRVWSGLSECSSARLPRIEATYELPDQFVVVYDFIPGEPLERQVRKNGPLEAAEAVSIAQQVCEAADELHRHGIIHRDISPANIVLAADGAHLIDLGIARMRVDGAPHDTTSLGTWGYASPEQYGFAQTDARSDVYSIGSVLGFLVTGIRPGDDGFDEALQMGELPRDLCAVIAKARAFEPSARYQSAAEMAEALAGKSSDAVKPSTESTRDDGAAQNRPVESAFDNAENAGHTAEKKKRGVTSRISADNGWHPVQTARKRRRRKRVIAYAVALAVAVAVAAAVGFGLNGKRPADESSNNAAQKATTTASTSSDDTNSKTRESGNSSDTSAAQPVKSTDARSASLELLESGWSCGESGYISFGASIKNASADTAIEYPAIRVTGYDKAGKVLFSNEHMLSVIEPGQTISFADIDGNGTVPDHVTFEAVDPDPDWFTAPQDTPVLSVHNVQETPLDSGEASFGGTLSLDSAPDGFDPNQVRFNVILRDADGKICGGITDFTTCPKLGQSVPFSVRGAALPSYTSYEIYAMAW